MSSNLQEFQQDDTEWKVTRHHLFSDCQMELPAMNSFYLPEGKTHLSQTRQIRFLTPAHNSPAVRTLVKSCKSEIDLNCAFFATRLSSLQLPVISWWKGLASIWFFSTTGKRLVTEQSHLFVSAWPVTSPGPGKQTAMENMADGWVVLICPTQSQSSKRQCELKCDKVYQSRADLKYWSAFCHPVGWISKTWFWWRFLGEKKQQIDSGPNFAKVAELLWWTAVTFLPLWLIVEQAHRWNALQYRKELCRFGDNTDSSQFVLRLTLGFLYLHHLEGRTEPGGTWTQLDLDERGRRSSINANLIVYH